MTDKSNKLIEIAIKNGAGVSETLAGVPIKIVVDEAVLQATIDVATANTPNINDNGYKLTFERVPANTGDYVCSCFEHSPEKVGD